MTWRSVSLLLALSLVGCTFQVGPSEIPEGVLGSFFHAQVKKTEAQATPSTEAAVKCPPVKPYSASFRQSLASELPFLQPNTAQVLSDYWALREWIKENCQ